MLSFRKNQRANPKKTSGWKDGKTERKDGQTLIYRTLPATAGSPNRLRVATFCRCANSLNEALILTVLFIHFCC